MGLDRNKWGARTTLDICSLVKIDTAILEGIKLNGLVLKIFLWATNLEVPIAAF